MTQANSFASNRVRVALGGSDRQEHTEQELMTLGFDELALSPGGLVALAHGGYRTRS